MTMSDLGLNEWLRSEKRVFKIIEDGKEKVKVKWFGGTFKTFDSVEMYNLELMTLTMQNLGKMLWLSQKKQKS